VPISYSLLRILFFDHKPKYAGMMIILFSKYEVFVVFKQFSVNVYQLIFISEIDLNYVLTYFI